jgi:hypothetical protein
VLEPHQVPVLCPKPKLPPELLPVEYKPGVVPERKPCISVAVEYIPGVLPERKPGTSLAVEYIPGVVPERKPGMSVAVECKQGLPVEEADSIGILKKRINSLLLKQRRDCFKI